MILKKLKLKVTCPIGEYWGHRGEYNSFSDNKSLKVFKEKGQKERKGEIGGGGRWWEVVGGDERWWEVMRGDGSVVWCDERRSSSLLVLLAGHLSCGAGWFPRWL